MSVEAKLGEQHSLRLHRMVAFVPRPSYSNSANNLFASSCDSRPSHLLLRKLATCDPRRWPKMTSTTPDRWSKTQPTFSASARGLFVRGWGQEAHRSGGCDCPFLFPLVIG